MKSSGSDEPKILVIGEAPGADEDVVGKPFVGRAGSLLRDVLQEVADLDNDIRFTNVVRCRPPDNKITKDAIMYCRQFAVDDIQEYKPDMVFLMGNSPLSGILGETGITSWNGSIIKKYSGVDGKETTFVPLFHPAYILRNPSATEEWLQAIFKVVEGEDDGGHKIEIILPKNYDEVMQMMLYLEDYQDIVFDFETTSLNAYLDISELIAVSFAAGDRSYSIPLMHKDANAWWEDGKIYDMIDYSIRVTKSILQKHSGHLTGHNTKFDSMWARSRLKIDVEIGGDTMLISHMLDSRQGIHGLKRLAGVYCGMYEYENELTQYINTHPECNPNKTYIEEYIGHKNEFDEFVVEETIYRAGNYGNIPLKILLPYAAADGKATLLLEETLLPRLTEKQRILYDELVIPASNALSRMQSNGFTLDKFIAYRYFYIYTHLIDGVLAEINKDKYVKKITALRNKKNREDIVGTRRKLQIYSFNPNSHDQLSVLYFQYYNIPVLAVSKKTKAPSTSGKIYKPIEHKYPILHLVRKFKLYAKALSTYLGPAMRGEWLSDDGMVHTTMNQHGTRTSRLSSSDPLNLQNLPTPEKEPGTVLENLPIKNIFTHRDWWDYQGNDIDPADIHNDIYDTGALVMGDYSGMELRTFSSLAKCMPMIEIHKSGLDFHSVVAIMSLTHKYPDQIDRDEVSWFRKNKPEVRYRYKWTNWTLLYGGDAYTLHKLYDVPLGEAEETVNMYYSLFPEVLEYKKATTQFAEDHGYIESPFGRREYLPYINSSDEGKRNHDIRAAVNMPPQSSASDTLMMAMIFADKEIIKRGMASKLVNTVHDSLVADVPRNEIVSSSLLMKDVMENVIDYAKIYAPRIDFSWLICPLKSDIDIGTHYGIHTDFDEWAKVYEKETIK